MSIFDESGGQSPNYQREGRPWAYNQQAAGLDSLASYQQALVSGLTGDRDVGLGAGCWPEVLAFPPSHHKTTFVEELQGDVDLWLSDVDI